ncbi:MAG: hypothetical protein HON51_13230 [Gammaproteobacteria bacterium]|nr:hypothetical protein [Gammaproteobacteria bacterium]MBT5826585.1 hypothetical protein [Gammaproteobacteria bacterium]MBT6420053.1 hypothetical protein [Gammaproteobacteria bacterium]MBT6577156.1 hypothetical protein [Gammaproteobacteria bacterium]MBT7435228.1 hypothetical protein [Gammaproteobacteria bacterium]
MKKGTAAESLAKVKLLEALLINAGVNAEVASIDTANMGPDRRCDRNGPCFRQHEWDSELIFGMVKVKESSIGPDAPYFFLTSPTCRAYSDGIEVIDLLVMGHAQLDLGSFSSTFPSQNYQNIEAELDLLISRDLGKGPVNMGIVFHPREYIDTLRTDTDTIAKDDKSYIDAIFDLIAAKGFHSIPVRDVLKAQQVSCP